MNKQLIRIIERYFKYYGIGKTKNPNLISEIELRKLIIDISKTSYALGIGESKELNNFWMDGKNGA